MAELVLGIGTSHSPVLALPSHEWVHRAAVDRANEALNLSDGRRMSYQDLLAEVGPRYEDDIVPEILAEKERASQAALDRIADELEAANPDAVIIVGDDQAELFGANNQPAVAIYHGAEMVTLEGKYAQHDAPEWMRKVGLGYLMERSHVTPAAGELGLTLIQGLIDRHVDVASVAAVADPTRAGFGHAYGFVVKRLMRGKRIPVLPIMLNTYFPPNVPTAARCFDIGKALREVVEAMPTGMRLAIVASGGLSHFVVDEALDRRVLQALQEHDESFLRGIPRGALQSGSSETLNWILVAGAMGRTPMAWSEYQPIYRTPAGTGVGVAFCAWRPA